MIDINRLHMVANNYPYLPRRAGKSYFSLTCLVQGLELNGEVEKALFVCRNVVDIGNYLGMLLDICNDLNIEVYSVSHNSVRTEFGDIKFIIIDRLRCETRGLRNYIMEIND